LEAEQLQKIAIQYKGTSWTLEKNPEGKERAALLEGIFRKRIA